MKNAQISQVLNMEHYELNPETLILRDEVQKSWEVIAPFWPLKNIIAVNPLQGLEHLPIEESFIQGAAYFEQEDLPEPMAKINRLTIKWLQAFFDNGQATITMPLRKKGLYSAWRQLALFDEQLHEHNLEKKEWLKFLSDSSEQVIAECLLRLSIKKEDRQKFMTLILTTLPGWASYIKYCTEWNEIDPAKPVSQSDYLAVRLIITAMTWPEAKDLLEWYEQVLSKISQQRSPLTQILESEKKYRLPLLQQIVSQPLQRHRTHKAQFVFCIDVRSEPFRRAIETVGDYETFGFAGFFGIPVQIENELTGENYASCPVLVKPKHIVKEFLSCLHNLRIRDKEGCGKLNNIKGFYQSLKYTFATPFALVETLGVWSGAWMILKSFYPYFAHKLKSRIANSIRPIHQLTLDLEDICFLDRCSYAESILKIIGLTKNFSPLVVLCGHGSTTLNNAFATALDCGACGGRHGASNARIMAEILNDHKVRASLEAKNIIIPNNTKFIAAEHNTTTDEVIFFNKNNVEGVDQLKHDLQISRHINNMWRCNNMRVNERNPSTHALLRSIDWAQVRPEWGLARNASFIIAPRNLTKNINLQGRSFLHSYDYTQDLKGESLTAILTAPMVVAQWINSQYLFSTLNNAAYGAGSKITKNIIGKFGIMQGNASDLMTGLPLQSVYESDTQSYHELQRLMTIVFATRSKLDKIIAEQKILQKLFGNGWVTLTCVEPDENQTYFLQRDLTWILYDKT
ncbi:MAG: DUF2309 domain-containing protein [Alphaproteobacteria bacterium]